MHSSVYNRLKISPTIDDFEETERQRVKRARQHNELILIYVKKQLEFMKSDATERQRDQARQHNKLIVCYVKLQLGFMKSDMTEKQRVERARQLDELIAIHVKVEVNKAKQQLDSMKSGDFEIVTIFDNSYLLQMLRDRTLMHIRDELAFCKMGTRDKNCWWIHEQDDFFAIATGQFPFYEDSRKIPVDAPTQFSGDSRFKVKLRQSTSQTSGSDLVELQRPTEALEPSSPRRYR